MSSTAENAPTARRSTRERKQVKPFVSAPGSSLGKKRKHSGVNEEKNGSGKRKAVRKRVQVAPVLGPPAIKNVEEIELHPLASGGLPDPLKGFRSLRDEAQNRMIYYGTTTGASKRPAIIILDCETLKSESVIANLQYDVQSSQRSFPTLTNPWAVLVKPEPDETFLIIFGGTNQGQGGGNATLFYVDIARKRWGEIPPVPDAPSPKSRDAGTACVIGSQLFAFGGSVMGGKATSYCVGDVSFDKSSQKIGLTWTTVDKPYPAGIPYSGSFGGFVLLDEGRYILLLPGGRNKGYQVLFSGEKDEEMTLYNTEADEFTRIPSGGMRTLPTAYWYHSMPPPTALLPKLPQFEVEEGVLRPPSFLLAHTGDSPFPHLCAVSVHTASNTVQVKRIDVEEELQRIWDESEVEFFAFFTTTQKMCFWGMKGDEPVEGSAYVAEVKIKM